VLLGSGSLKLILSGLVPGDKAIQVVAVRAVSSKLIFIKKPFNPAPQADLVGVILSAHRPTHLAVPATPQDYHPGTCQSRREQAPRPKPTPLLFFTHFFSHYPEPVSCSLCSGYDESPTHATGTATYSE
jgi:hypothetical protein